MVKRDNEEDVIKNLEYWGEANQEEGGNAAINAWKGESFWS